MSTHLSPIESIREKEKEFDIQFCRNDLSDTKTYYPPYWFLRDDVTRNEIQTHINLTLTSFIEAEIEKWEGERKEYFWDNGDCSICGFSSLQEDESHGCEYHNSAISSVIEHLQEIKKQI